MSIIPELPTQISESMVSLEADANMALTACADCQMADTCRIAAGLARLARIRDRMVPHEGNMWLRGRIDEYLGIRVCLAGVFGIQSTELDAPVTAQEAQQASHRSLTLEMALRHRGPTGLDRAKPGDRVEHAVVTARL